MNEALQTYYFDRVEKALRFIEENLNREIEQKMVAETACCSLYHFHRMFSALMGESLGDYIRNRRINEAGRRLIETSDGILDIALEFGYGSQAAFSRIFKDAYGMTPGKFRRNGFFSTLRNRKTKEQLLREYNVRREGMKFTIIEKKKMLVAGKAIRVNSNGENRKRIPLFWQEFMENDEGSRIPDRFSDCSGTLGLCMNDEDENGDFTYIIGDPVSKADKLPEGYVSAEIPEGIYAVFTSIGPFPEAIQKTWDYIYAQWLPSSEWKARKAPEFEYYDERCRNDPKEMDIYIPVQKGLK